MDDKQLAYEAMCAGGDVGKPTPWKKKDQNPGAQRRVLWDDSTEGGEEDITLPEEDEWLIWAGGPGRKQALLRFNAANLDDEPPDPIGRQYQMLFKMQNTDSKLFRRVMDVHGISESSASVSDFNILWTGVHPKPFVLRNLYDYQRVNHFPRSYELTRKDRLCKNIERMKYIRGAKHFDFIPPSYIMPTEYQEFCSAFLKDRGAWIVKPVASSRGRGIYLINHPDQIPLDESVVVCKYIENPLLVDGYKCDVRLYVAVTSYDPLVIYLYEEGLIRFAAVKYDQSAKMLWNPCMHLTNYSVNKYHTNYVQNDDAEVDDYGNKWSLSALLRHLKLAGEDTTRLMQDIEAIIVKSIIAVAPTVTTACKMFVPTRKNCFELYGFDILIDSSLRPWLLEVNLSPSLGCDTPLDSKVKSAVISDLFTLIGVPAVDPGRARQVKQRQRAVVRVRAPSMDSVPRGGKPLRSALSAEEARIVREVREEDARRGAFIRIFPAPETWSLYSCFLAPVNSHLNQMLHEELYPHTIGGPQGSSGPRSLCRKSSSIPSLSITSRSRSERTACYERPLARGSKDAFVGAGEGGRDAAERATERLTVKREIIEQMQRGVRMSRYQARLAFSFYLQHIQRRLMCNMEQVQGSGQLELVLRFIRKAARNLTDAYAIQTPGRHFTPVEKAILIAKQLGDFIHLYNRETLEHVAPRESPALLDAQLHKQFVTGASESDLEEALTLHTSLFNSADLFLGRARAREPASRARTAPSSAATDETTSVARADEDGAPDSETARARQTGALSVGNLLKTSLRDFPAPAGGGRDRVRALNKIYR
ncbi:tubulin polyglutamylase TTLL5-like [Amphibalanus amphitrite]|uniref:tubulin polyglutamylase TTLL5-like n=1 Tax=Amphibalanus amphitrite TaxID=1232801 RepID=UPI001C9220EE|nr:tubulin polyglutamylase TTLL5-like [Amphibalanus amphitrite]